MRAALVARLERVRGNLTDAQFAQLVDRVTRTAQRFEEIDARRLHRATPAAAPRPAAQPAASGKPGRPV
jgi:hypothetical protein